MSSVATIEHTTYRESVHAAFDAVGGGDIVSSQEAILLKPNLVDASSFPVTTHPDFVAEVINAVRAHTEAPIVIAEGCGAATMETDEVFQKLGYTEMARRMGVKLLDLNHAPLVHKEIPDCEVFPEMWLPEVAFTHCVLSLPVLKRHSLALVTGTLKNMMGFAPPSHYSGGGYWKKAAFHARMQTSVRDLSRYIMPALTIMDATVGMANYHLGGAHCDPPVNKVLASADGVALDREACGLLGVDWHDVGHLR